MKKTIEEVQAKITKLIQETDDKITMYRQYGDRQKVDQMLHYREGLEDIQLFIECEEE